MRKHPEDAKILEEFERDFTFNVVVVGAPRVGKTSLIKTVAQGQVCLEESREYNSMMDMILGGAYETNQEITNTQLPVTRS